MQYLFAHHQKSLARNSYSTVIFTQTKEELDEVMQLAFAGELPPYAQKLFLAGSWMTGSCNELGADLFRLSIDCHQSYRYEASVVAVEPEHVAP